MIQSFHYAAVYGFRNEVESGVIYTEQAEYMQQCTQFWEQRVSEAFLSSYLTTAEAGNFLPTTEQTMKVLLNNYFLSKAIHDVGYKIVHRSDEVEIPMQRLLQFVDMQLAWVQKQAWWLKIFRNLCKFLINDTSTGQKKMSMKVEKKNK